MCHEIGAEQNVAIYTESLKITKKSYYSILLVFELYYFILFCLSLSYIISTLRQINEALYSYRHY